MGEELDRRETLMVVKKVLVLVEGQTEEQFVKRVLDPYLNQSNISMVPVIVKTKENIRGGSVNFDNFQKQVQRLLNDASTACVTMMFDYYGLPKDFFDKTKLFEKNCYERVELVEKDITVKIQDKKFIPYLQLHEFEALLFSNSQVLTEKLNDRKNSIQKIVKEFPNPEEINDNKSTCPSQRIKNIYPRYQKPTDGITIALNIGLDQVRKKCRHFNQWLSKLENHCC